MAATLKQSLERAVQRLSLLPIDTLLERRYQKFRQMGVFEELASAEGKPAGDEPPTNAPASGAAEPEDEPA